MTVGITIDQFSYSRSTAILPGTEKSTSSWDGSSASCSKGVSSMGDDGSMIPSSGGGALEGDDGGSQDLSFKRSFKC